MTKKQLLISLCPPSARPSDVTYFPVAIRSRAGCTRLTCWNCTMEVLGSNLGIGNIFSKFLLKTFSTLTHPWWKEASSEAAKEDMPPAETKSRFRNVRPINSVSRSIRRNTPERVCDTPKPQSRVLAVLRMSAS
jgi:hypothetical protein